VKAARMIIADDHELMRRGIRSALEEVPSWKVVAEARNGTEATELAERLSPDIVILDLCMPVLNGLDATRRLIAAELATRVLVLTEHETEQLLRDVLSAGAHGYILKSDSSGVLVTAVEALLSGTTFFAPKIASLVIGGYLRNASGARNVNSMLSRREREIVQLLAEGGSNKEVARTLGISVKTAESHRGNIMRKMGFGSLADLIRYAVRNQMIEV
jgi:DNA-binding NarL/FixJ family response regulator